MMWVLWAMIAIMIAVILYSSIEDQISPEFRNLLGLPEAGIPASKTVKATTPGQAQAKKDRYARDSKSWLFQTAADIQEMSRDALEPLEDNGQPLDPASIFFSCQKGTLFAWLEMRIPVASADPVKILVNGKPQHWKLGNEYRLFSEAPLQLASLFSKEPKVQFEIKLQNTEKVARFSYTTNATKEGLSRFPETCTR